VVDGAVVRGAGAVKGAVASKPPLVLHEEISDPENETFRDRHEEAWREGGCDRWPETMRLVASDGTVRRGRCGSVNLCSYCAKLRAIENAEMLSLDALDHGAPEVWACLTTRSADPAPSTFYRAREQVRKALRRRWPDCQDATLVEFTTGYGSRSGGRRRPHWNALLKGVPVAAVEEAQEVVSRVWCGQVDAEASRQHVGPVADAGGLMRYLALHFQKESQSPPRGWRGHRFVASRGYFPGGAPAARERAKESLRLGRAVHWANAVSEAQWLDHGHVLDGDDLEELIAERLLEEAARSWSVKKIHATGMDVDRKMREGAKEPFRGRRSPAGARGSDLL
jgi:hypothetical protein